MARKRVIFIRPGETEWNKIGRWQGIVSIPINTVGMKQAQRLAKFVRNVGMDMIYSSDLRRAKDTATVIAEYTNTKIIYDPRLRERSMGEWQGLTSNEIQQWYRADYQKYLADRLGYVIPGGESQEQVAKRVHACFDEIIAGESETIGIISHTTAMRSLLGELIPDSDANNLSFRNMSVTTIAQQDDGSWKITQLDDVSHLEGMPSIFFDTLEIDKLT